MTELAGDTFLHQKKTRGRRKQGVWATGCHTMFYFDEYERLYQFKEACKPFQGRGMALEKARQNYQYMVKN